LLAHGAVDKLSPGHLLREAQTASSLSHPNICTIHQVGETGNDFYVVMELIEGRSLSDLITATGLSMEIVTRYGTQIADALATGVISSLRSAIPALAQTPLCCW
jgi:serine/threonine protein kinase